MKRMTTPERLLEAGGEVFAEKGFRDATIREIVRRAGGANLAAVGYHFGSKEAFHAAVLEREMRIGLEKYPPGGGLPPDAPAEQRLLAFVRAFLHRILDPGLRSRMGRLMSREMMDPGVSLERLVEALIRPLFVDLCALMREFLPPGSSAVDAARCAKSVVGQILLYHHGAAVLRLLAGEPDPGPGGIEGLARHIAAFSRAGAAGLRRRRKGRR